jgi:coenzyme Q-binding protein COQ10
MVIRRQESYYSRFSSKQLYDLVADIEKYPEFLPWCSSARILETREDAVIAELAIRFAAFVEKYTSQVTFIDPGNEVYEIKVEAIEGPFKTLKNNWLFSYDESSDQTEVTFEIQFEFKSFLLQKMVGSMFEIGLSKMMDAFEKRAEQIYEATRQ